MNEIEFLRYILEGIVSDKDAINIEKKEDELGILLTLSVSKDDMGIVIGKGGNTINSIRTYLEFFD